MIATVLMVLDVIVCIALIASVLMQSGKGSGLSVTIGLGTAFGIITLALAKING